MIGNILNSENIVILSIHTKSNYKDKGKHDGFDYNVTSVGLWEIYMKNFTPPFFQFLNAHTLPYVNKGSNYDYDRNNNNA